MGCQIPETGADYPVRVSLYKDIVTVALDTTGESLHKRGYRKMTSKAPIEETLAAALIMLTPWKSDRIMVDPFCGSGTFPIEAGDDRCEYGAGHESLLPVRKLETDHSAQVLV